MLAIFTPASHFHHIGSRNEVVIEEVTVLVVAVSVFVELFAHIRVETTAANAFVLLDIFSHIAPHFVPG